MKSPILSARRSHNIDPASVGDLCRAAYSHHVRARPLKLNHPQRATHRAHVDRCISDRTTDPAHTKRAQQS